MLMAEERVVPDSVVKSLLQTALRESRQDTYVSQVSGCGHVLGHGVVSWRAERRDGGISCWLILSCLDWATR